MLTFLTIFSIICVIIILFMGWILSGLIMGLNDAFKHIWR